MRNAVAVLVPAVLAAFLVGCSSPATGAGCEELAAADVVATGGSHFTDAPPFTLTVEETALVGEDRATVLVSLDPSDAVGYDPMLFFSECRGGEAVLLGVYVSDEPDGAFTLLFTTQEGSDAGDVPMDAP